MASLTTLNAEILRDLITRAVQDVFKTMLSLDAKLTWSSDRHPGAEPPSFAGPLPQVAGAVGFVGEVNGLVYLHFDGEFARIITGRLLGMSPTEVRAEGDEVVNDAIGEVTNMTVGSYKNVLCDMGLPCKLTVPSILRGSNFSIEPVSGALRQVCLFEVDQHMMRADLLMKVGE